MINQTVCFIPMMSAQDEKRSHSVKMGGWWLHMMPRQAYVMVCALVALQIAMAVKLEGGSAVAMAGRGCVVLAMDNRVGTQYVKTPRFNHGCHSITEDQYTHKIHEHKSRHRVKVRTPSFATWSCSAGACWLTFPLCHHRVPPQSVQGPAGFSKPS